ncbi:tetratricopeptide repeat protein, partial [Micromonospora chalcea]|uniref:tetratricopeptide repeat protein n=1 Tax=Micromonospora chalcea TaxID=1874 RepID=UPI00332CD68F
MFEKRLADAVPVQAQHSTDRATGEPTCPDDLLRSVDDLVRRVDDLRRSLRGAEALRLIEDALAQMSDPPVALVVAHGRTLLALHRPNDAAEVLRRSYELDDGSPDVSAWLIASLSRGRHYDDAAALTADLCERFFGSALVRIATGRFLLDQYRFEEALPYFREAFTLDPEDPRALRWLLYGLRRARRFDEVEALAAMTELAGMPQIEYARSQLDRYQFECVLAGLSEVTDERVEVPALQTRLEALRSLHRLDEAQRLTEENLDRRPENPRLWIELGWVFGDRHRLEEALAAFNKALTVDPTDAEALEWRTTALRRMHGWREAEQAAQEAIARRPEVPELYLELGYLHQDQHDYGRALGAFEQALAIDPKHETALEWRVTELRRLRDFDHAEQATCEAITQRPDSLALRLQLGYLYDDQHDYERALGAFEQALAIDPKHEWA